MYHKYEIKKDDIYSVEFDDEFGNNKITSLIVDVTVSQEGEGTPSFDNIRPIIPTSSILITNNGTERIINIEKNSVSSVLASGTIDVVSGTANVTGIFETFNGDSIYDYGTTNNIPYVSFNLFKKIINATNWGNTLINEFKTSTKSGVDGTAYLPSYSTARIRVFSSLFTSKSVAANILNTHPVQIYYPITAQTEQFDSNILLTQVGKNIITVDGKLFSISYQASFETAVMDAVGDIPTNDFKQSISKSNDALLYVNRLPSYYIDPVSTPTTFEEAQGYLDAKISTIPKNGKSFIYITDVHWDGNEKHSTDIINYIRRRTGISKVLFGGDIFGNASNKYLAMKKAASYMSQAKRAFGQDFIACVGDHDSNTVGVTRDEAHFLPYEQLGELFMSDLERFSACHVYNPEEKLANYVTPGSNDYNEIIAFFHTVYYVDDESANIRYISLNCGNGGDYGALYNIFGTSGSTLLRLQADWLAKTLMSTPDGYDVIVLSHKGNTSYAGSNALVINSILYGFKRKAPIYPHPATAQLANIDSWWPNTTRYDFTEAPDINRIITINGHHHADRLAYFGRLNGSTDNTNGISLQSESIIHQPDNAPGEAVNTCQIPIIITACDSLGAAESTSPSMTKNTITEQCFDVITLTNDNRIVMTRIGAGEDRVLYLSKEDTEN